MATTSTRNWSMTIIYTVLAALATFGMRILPNSFPVNQHFEYVTTNHKFPNGVPLRRVYTGIESIDFGLTFLVAAFIDGVSGWDRSFQLQQPYFLFSFFAVISLWEVEACRTRSSWIISTMLFVWTLMYQTIGGAIIIPSYYLAHTWATFGDNPASKPRSVPTATAKALLPALTLGYLLPTIALYYPWSDLYTIQGFTALWQTAPLFPIILLNILPYFFSNEPTTKTNPTDLKHLQRFYTFVGLITALAHCIFVNILIITADPQRTFREVMFLNLEAAKLSAPKSLLFIFQIDFWIIFAASLVWIWQAVWEMKSIGATDVGLVSAAFGIAVGSVLIGPGAVMCVVWYWREEKLVALESMAAKTK